MKNVIKELGNVFDLSNIDWNDVWLKSQKSLIVETWNMRKNGLSSEEISKILNLNKMTIQRYLRNENVE